VRRALLHSRRGRQCAGTAAGKHATCRARLRAGGRGRAGAAAAAADAAAAAGGCVLCQSPDFLRDGFGPRTMIICDQCEREFHVGCLASTGRAHLSELPEGAARPARARGAAPSY